LIIKLEAVHISAIPTTAMPGFSAEQLGAITLEAMSGFKAEQLHEITIIAIIGFSQEQINALSGDARFGFTLEQERSTDAQLLPDYYPVEQEDVIVDEVPVDEVPVDEVPVDEAPVDEAPVDEVPVDEAPVDEVPVDEVPVDEVPVDEVPVDEASAEMPALGEATAVDAEGNSVETNSEFAGGVETDGEFTDEVSLADEVEVSGDISVDENDVGQVVEIVVFASFVNVDGVVDYFMLNQEGGVELWGSDTGGEMPNVADLVPFQSGVELGNTQFVMMYTGKFVYAGPLAIQFGYRTAEGTVVTNADPIDISITEEETAPVDEAPVDEVPVDEAPVDEAPVDEVPVDEAPVDEAPVDEAPVDEAPVAI
jgi:hypothetical protein